MSFGLLLYLSILFSLIIPQQVNADTMIDQNYLFHIDSSDNPNQTTIPSSNSSFNEDALPAQSSGSQEMDTNDAFSFAIDNTTIDYGTLSPGNPITRTNTISISPGQTAGYSVFISEDHALKSNTNIVIPDTNCDNGQCTSFLFDTWDNALTYGFGYRCDNQINNDCIPGFAKDLYRQFPNQEQSKTPELIMAGFPKTTSAAELSYKLSISANQAKQQYENAITILAVPMY